MNFPGIESRPPGRRNRPGRWLATGLAVLAVLAAVVLTRLGKNAPAGLPDVAQDRTALEVRGGRFYAPGASDPFSGWMLDHYADGSVHLRSAVRAGRLEGESVGWFTNGAVEVREEFRAGLAHGVRTTWHLNGQVRSEGRLKDGRQDGWYRQWNEAGQLVTEAEFADGKPHGLSLAWHPDGSLKAEVLMQHGEVQARHFYPAGERREPTLSASATKPLVTAQIK